LGRRVVFGLIATGSESTDSFVAAWSARLPELCYCSSAAAEAAFAGLAVAALAGPVFPCLMSQTPQRLG